MITIIIYIVSEFDTPMKLASASYRIPSGSLRPGPSRCPRRSGFGGLIPCSSASQMKHGRERGHKVARQDRSRRFSSAQSSTSEAVCGVTPSVEALYSRALMLARSEDFEQARELFQTVAERFPYYEKNWISWAQMEKRAHAMNSEVKWNTCRQILQKALCVNPTGSRIIQAWGLMELQKRNFWAAVTMLDRSVLYDPFLKPVLLWKPVLEARRQRALERKHRANTFS